MIRSIAEIGAPSNALALLYAALAAGIVWGLVVGAITALMAIAVKRGGDNE